MGFFAADSDSRLVRIERKLDAIIEHLGIEITSEFSPQIQQAIRQGNKIEAIKLYRAETKVGLREAKEVIESYM